MLVLVIGELKFEEEDENEGDFKKKIANPLRRDAEAFRVSRIVFIFPLPPRRAALKERVTVQFIAEAWRDFRQLARCLMIQSVSARSKPMSCPAFSDSIHLCRRISSRSA